MKNISLLLFVLATTFVSCKRSEEKGSGEVVTKDYGVAAFTSIDISAPIDAEIKIANVAQPTVTIKGYGNLVKKIKCEVKNGVLEISKERIISFVTDKDIVAEITMPSLTALTIKGAADAVITGRLTGSSFRLQVKGAGDVDIENLQVANFESTVSGAGDLKVKVGAVNVANINVAGAGDVDAYGLQIKQLRAKISGTGDIETSVAESMDATINGAGSISYKGSPTVRSDINGIGSIDKVD